MTAKQIFDIIPRDKDNAINGRRSATPPERGGEAMPITMTIHILGFVITIKVKSENLHSAK